MVKHTKPVEGGLFNIFQSKFKYNHFGGKYKLQTKSVHSVIPCTGPMWLETCPRIFIQNFFLFHQSDQSD